MHSVIVVKNVEKNGLHQFEDMNVDENEDETGVNNLGTKIDAVIGDIDMWKEQEKM